MKPEPDKEYRFVTGASRERLAQHFNLPNEPRMQDWEYIVAQPKLIPALLEHYQLDTTCDEDRFTLAEILMQSFEDLDEDVSSHPQWPDFRKLLIQNKRLHRHTLEYWSCLEYENQPDAEPFHITIHIRPLLLNLPPRLAKRRRCRVFTKDQIDPLTTAQLMKRRKIMLGLEQNRLDSDCDQDELDLIALHQNHWLFFKDDPRWQTQYQTLKDILNSREHYLSKPQRKLLRQQKAKRNRR